jgi:general stress protein 26
MELSDVITESQRLGMWAHVATVSASGQPYVTPVHPCWDGDTLWTMVGTDSTKVKNVSGEPRCSFHWQVSEATGFDSLILWGTATVHDDLDTKRRLWEGVFDYNLNDFAPGGPDDSDGTGFMAFTPTKAVLLRQFGAGGREEWRA